MYTTWRAIWAANHAHRLPSRPRLLHWQLKEAWPLCGWHLVKLSLSR